MLSKEYYRTYVQILKDELVPAMGCTEPIAIAYAGAVARKTLGASGAGGGCGQPKYYKKCKKRGCSTYWWTAWNRSRSSCRNRGRGCCEGTGGHLHVEQEDIEAMGSFLKEVPCSVCEASSDLIFDIRITLLSWRR